MPNLSLEDDRVFLDGFFYGMATVGQLFPSVPPVRMDGGPASAWRGVASSFFQAGNNIRDAVKEFSEYQRQRPEVR
jgi:hypothetical protein